MDLRRPSEGGILFLYYRFLPVSVIGGLLFAIPQEKNYAGSVMRRRQARLRIQFKEFLKIIAISISGGSGRSVENAVKDSLRELNMIFNEDTDIIREIALIVSDYKQAGIPMSKGFAKLGERSEIDDIVSFFAIYRTIEGKTSDFGYIIAQTRDIIKDKAEITMETWIKTASPALTRGFPRPRAWRANITPYPTVRENGDSPTSRGRCSSPAGTRKPIPSQTAWPP
ncbi:MAG: hypothetical protein HFG75_13400 [Hungatella sp.]|nr:hypothetical protein [Hungatella sp.]